MMNSFFIFYIESTFKFCLVSWLKVCMNLKKTIKVHYNPKQVKSSPWATTKLFHFFRDKNPNL